MNRSAFEFLYIHANSLAELGLDRFVAGLELPMADYVDERAPLGADEREALALAQLSKIDMSSMMDGFVWETPEHDAAVQSMLQQLQAEAALAASLPPLAPEELSAPLFDLADGSPAECAPAEMSLILYLEKAYSVSDQIALRVDQGMGRIDMLKLDALLAALPGDLPPLTGALSADGLAQWLTCYQAGHASLLEIVTIFRDVAFRC